METEGQSSNLTDSQRGLLMFLRNRQLPDRPSWFLPQGIGELEDAVREGRSLPAIRIETALRQEGIPLEAWDGLALGSE